MKNLKIIIISSVFLTISYSQSYADDIFEFTKDKNGNFVNDKTGFVVDADNRTIGSLQGADGKILLSKKPLSYIQISTRNNKSLTNDINYEIIFSDGNIAYRKRDSYSNKSSSIDFEILFNDSKITIYSINYNRKYNGKFNMDTSLYIYDKTSHTDVFFDNIRNELPDYFPQRKAGDTYKVYRFGFGTSKLKGVTVNKNIYTINGFISEDYPQHYSEKPYQFQFKVLSPQDYSKRDEYGVSNVSIRCIQHRYGCDATPLGYEKLERVQ